MYPGVFVRSVYFTDPNGIMLEFACLTRELGKPEDIARPGQSLSARLMPRLREVPKAEVTSETILRSYKALFGDRDPVSEPGTATGTSGDWWSVFANSPDVFEHAVNGFALYRGSRPIPRAIGATWRPVSTGSSRSVWSRTSPTTPRTSASAGSPTGCWNASVNCLDRHLPMRANDVAIIWEGDDPKDSRKITYAGGSRRDLPDGQRAEGARGR